MRKGLRIFFFFFVLATGVLSISISLVALEKPPTIWPVSEWKTSTPELLGIKSKALADLYSDETFKGNFMLIRSGYLVSEKYNQQKGKKYAPQIYSCTKGIISALVGIAIQRRHLSGANQKVLSFFPRYKRPNKDEQKKLMTIHHLLTMTSGLYWTDALSRRIIYDRSDWNYYILDQPMEAAPGTRFNYNSGNTQLLSAILQQSTGITSLEFARKHLFDPISISGVTWEKNPKGVYLGGWGISMSLEDMAKFGYLYLQNGRWLEKQVVPESWVVNSLKQHIEQIWNAETWGYGYLWSILQNWPVDAAALVGGYHGYTCIIAIVPDLKLVFVYSGPASHSTVFQLVKKHLLPSVTAYD